MRASVTAGMGNRVTPSLPRCHWDSLGPSSQVWPGLCTSGPAPTDPEGIAIVSINGHASVYTRNSKTSGRAQCPRTSNTRLSPCLRRMPTISCDAAAPPYHGDRCLARKWRRMMVRASYDSRMILQYSSRMMDKVRRPKKPSGFSSSFRGASSL